MAVRRRGVRRRGVGGGSGGGESGERPNLGRTHENFEHTAPTHHNTTQHNTTTTTHHTTQGGSRRVVLGKGGPSQGGPWPKKQDMSNKLSRRAAPLAKVFWESRMVRKGLGQKKGAGPKVVRKTKKHGKTNQKTLLSFARNKNKFFLKKNEKIP